MKKTVDDNGVIRINELTFHEFSRGLAGFDIANKHNGFKVPRFILFWKGLSVAEVKNRYNLVQRKYTVYDN